MKSPKKLSSSNSNLDKHLQKSYSYTNDHGSKNAPLFEQQSPSYRSKSIDKKVTELNDKLILGSVKQKDYRKAISQLHQLENYIHNQDNQTSKTNKLLYYYELSICYYNHAVVYQKVNNDEETAKYFQKSLKNLQYMHGYITSREQGVSYSIQVAKLQIQYCSILSQTGKHQEAITYAEKALLKLIECFRILEALCFQFMMENRLPQTNSNSRDINFKKYVVFQAEKILKQLSALPEPHELPSQFKKKYDSLMYFFDQIRQKTFFWKDNSENNQKQLRKELQTQRKQVNSERNILGVQKNSYLSDNLTLEALTNLEVKSIKYSFNNDPFFLLSTPKLTEMAFFVAMIYFMIATEIRFSQVDLNMNKLKIDEKYKKLSRDQRMIKCKMIHMKAIEIAGKFLPEKNEFFTHILNRFNKNYKCIMEEINEESKEQSVKELSSSNSKLNHSQKDVLPQDEYGIQSNFNPMKDLQKSKAQAHEKDEILVVESQNPSTVSLKKIKKAKLFEKENNLEEAKLKLKRKFSSSKEKQNHYRFQKHQRSNSLEQTHLKRSLSFQKTQGSIASIRMISSFNGDYRENIEKRERTRTKTLTQSAKKRQEKMFKKKTHIEEMLGEMNFANVDNITSSKAKSKGKKQKSSEYKAKLKGVNSPVGKRKVSSNKMKLKVQETGDYGESGVRSKKIIFAKK